MFLKDLNEDKILRIQETLKTTIFLSEDRSLPEPPLYTERQDLGSVHVAGQGHAGGEASQERRGEGQEGGYINFSNVGVSMSRISCGDLRG